MSTDDVKLFPYYERLVVRFMPGGVGKFFVSALLGLAFLAIHYLSIGPEIFNNWSWFLGLLITTAMLCLYYATHTLRSLISGMQMRSGGNGDHGYINELKNTLSDHKFVMAGSSFGILNCILGYFFGLPYSELSAVITIVIGYFLAGFVCGMAVLGIYGVCVSIAAFAHKSKPSIDFTSPDGCGGTSFLGEALVIFGSATLIVGVMMSVYIWKTEWSGDESDLWVVGLKWFWIAFPYVISLVAIVTPAASINKALTSYKINEDSVLNSRLSDIRRRLEDDHLDAAERQELRNDYQFQQGIRADLHRMRTWPFGMGANLKYVTVLVPNLVISANNASVWIKNYFENSGS